MLSFIMVLLLTGDAQAQSKKINTSIYEQEAEPEKTESFSAKVRVVRDISDEVEVFFEGDKAKGAYIVPRSLPRYGAIVQMLEKSRKPGGPAVSVTADSEKRIKSVEAAAKGGGFQVPEDPNQKWDFGKIPD
ncbi:hypothetical protein EZJ49_08280 [Bdellovibrio bacteriovorus]|uniref:hypothetical protein n=1 Tax=Bdellovibrio bacteriovorus TaxID=959 RepID=UPI0021CE2166|nr:hypothetical protein [Bdellovibrio bacteriovorus]UXR66245.1 hypothetical protein EZJ49_08280 [Bdellovibrio bacteriovorus]